MMRQSAIAIAKLRNLVINAINKEMNDSKIKVTEPEWPFFVDEEVDKHWDFVGYDNDTHTYKFQNSQKGFLMNYVPEIEEVTVGKIGSKPNVFFDKNLDNWSSFYYEDNLHYNRKTERWEYYDIATGEWTNVIMKKIPENQITENLDRDVLEDDFVVRYEFLNRDTMKSSDFVRYNREDYKPVYNFETGNFEYYTANGIAIHMADEHLWKLDNLKGDVVYFNAINGRRMTYNEKTSQYEIVKTQEEIEAEERAERERIAAEQAERERKIKEAEEVERKAREEKEARERQQKQDEENLGVVQQILNRAKKAEQDEELARAKAEKIKQQEEQRREDERREKIARAKREVEEAEAARKRELEERKRREEENRKRLVELAKRMGEMVKGNDLEQNNQQDGNASTPEQNNNASTPSSEEEKIQEGRQTLRNLLKKMGEGSNSEQNNTSNSNATNTILPDGTKKGDNQDNTSNKDATTPTSSVETKTANKEKEKNKTEEKGNKAKEQENKTEEKDNKAGKQENKNEEKDNKSGKQDNKTEVKGNKAGEQDNKDKQKEQEILERRLAIRKILEGNNEDKPFISDGDKYKIIVGPKTMDVDNAGKNKHYNMKAFQKIGLLATITTWFKQLFSMSVPVYEIGFKSTSEDSDKGNDIPKLSIIRTGQDNRTNTRTGQDNKTNSRKGQDNKTNSRKDQDNKTKAKKEEKNKNDVLEIKISKATLNTDWLGQTKQEDFKIKRIISGPFKNMKKYKGFIKGAACFTCGVACALSVNALTKTNNNQYVSKTDRTEGYKIVYGTSFDEELHRDDYKYEFIANYKDRQDQEQTSEEEIIADSNVNTSNEEEKAETYIVTNGDESKTYFVSAGTSYTGDALGVYPGMQFGENTSVEIFNRVLVKTDENGNDSIILSSKEQTWEEFARQNGLSMDQVNDMLKQEGVREMVAVQVPGLNHSIFNTYGWIDASELQHTDSLVTSTSNQQIAPSVVDEMEH